MSLDEDSPIKMALQSAFEAAVELDYFLAETDTEKQNEDDDDSSFASEERRLQASEVILRRALESIDWKDETDSSSSHAVAQHCLEACAESFDSPESQVPLLQPVSPFGSPISECHSKDTIPDSPPLVLSPKECKKRQIRAYGLRPNAEEEEKCLVETLSPKSVEGFAQVMANALFGHCEYAIGSIKGTMQDTVGVLLAAGIVVSHVVPLILS